MVGAGIHINAVGGDCPGKTELHADILRRSDIFVEYPPQTRIEGEIQQLPRRPSGDRTLAGDRRAAPRDGATRRQITLFDSVGFAIEDFSALRYVKAQLDAHRASMRSSTCSPIPTSRAICSACCCARTPPNRRPDAPRAKSDPIVNRPGDVPNLRLKRLQTESAG